MRVAELQVNISIMTVPNQNSPQTAYPSMPPSTFTHAHFQESRNSIYMETSMTSTTPAEINSPVLFGRLHARCWPKGNDGKGRGWKATPNNMAGSLDPANPVLPIGYSRSHEEKGRGAASTSLTLRGYLGFRQQLHTGNAPWSSQLGKRCASSSLRAPAANSHTLFGQPIARD